MSIPNNPFDLSLTKIVNTILKTKWIKCKVLKYSFGIICCARDILKYLNQDKPSILSALNDFSEDEDFMTRELNYIKTEWKELLKSINIELNYNKKTEENESLYDKVNKMYTGINKFYYNKVKPGCCSTHVVNDPDSKQDIPNSVLDKPASVLDKPTSVLENSNNSIKYICVPFKHDELIKYCSNGFNMNQYYLAAKTKYTLSKVAKESNKLDKKMLNNLIKKKQVLASILTVFQAKKYKLEYKINDCVFDLYFIDYKLIINYDENNNFTKNNYKVYKKKYLEKGTYTRLDFNFISYNPILTDFDVFKLLGSILNFMNRTK